MNAKPVGIIANPNSGKDIRRLVAYGSVFNNIEKINIIKRILMALDALEVKEVYIMPDDSGLGLRAMDDLDISLKTNILDMNINGAPSAVTKFFVENNGKKLFVTAVAIDFGGGRVARFIYRSQNPDKELELRYQESFNSFRPLQYAEAQMIKPTVVDIKTVSRDQSVSNLASGMADIVEDKEALFLLLNPKFENEKPVPGREYKSIRFER